MTLGIDGFLAYGNALRLKQRCDRIAAGKVHHRKRQQRDTEQDRYELQKPSRYVFAHTHLSLGMFETGTPALL